MNQRARTDWLLLAGFCGFLFFFGLAYFGLVGADEPRYAQIAREMWARRDWITPTLGGKPWLEKPVLYYWEAMLAYTVFGVSDWAARLPAAFSASLMVAAIHVFLRRFRPGFELEGALMAASAAGVIGFARAASMDMPLAAAFTIALLAWYAWHEGGHKGYLAVFYGFLALGTLAKGPVAPFLAGLIIAVFAALRRDLRWLWRTLWWPGIVLFCAVAFPWYVAVQLRNPEFFRLFILEHNLARFGTNLYRHQQPFWYYLPVALVALLPWIVFVLAALAETMRAWWAEGSALLDSEEALDGFLVLWLVLPIVFFSLSQSKLPGYILPAIPAGTLLLTQYLRRHIKDGERPRRALIVLHSVVAALLVVPALMLPSILLHHRLVGRTAALVSTGLALVLAAGIALTLASSLGLGLLRFVTLVPVVLAVAAVLRIGAPTLDSTLSARPLANEISRMETQPLPLAVFRVPRQTEYGLAFYRNQVISRYERGEVPSREHLLVATEGSQPQIAQLAGSRRVSMLGNFSAQHLDYYWVSAPGMQHHH